MTFEIIFSDLKMRLDGVIREMPSEQSHIERCEHLATVVNWKASNDKNEFGEMLGSRGVRLFDEITNRVRISSEKVYAHEMRDCGKFLYYLMFVHDLGKYDRETKLYNGSNHEMRSAEFVIDRGFELREKLGWSQGTVEILTQLIRYHGHLGVVRLGEVSSVYLAPILETLVRLDKDSRRLFLDYLILLTCCDAGASGNFEEGRYFLDESRVYLYDQLSEELLKISVQLDDNNTGFGANALLELAATVSHTAIRIGRIFTSDNRIAVSNERIEKALAKYISIGDFNTYNFALTQFDHGAYVFAPILSKLSRDQNVVSDASLERFICFLGRLSLDLPRGGLFQFRETFSMKKDLSASNRGRFDELYDGVESGDSKKIGDVLSRYQSVKPVDFFSN